MAANCFPIAKYIYLFALFVISFTLITTSKTLELLGLGLLFAVNIIYSVLLTSDVVGYMEKQSRQTYTMALSTWSIIIGNVFNLVSSIFLVIMLSKLKTEFSKRGTPIRLNGENRERLELFKTLWITSIVLLTVVSLNIYFNADRLAYSTSVFIDNLMNVSTTPTMFLMLFGLGMLVFGLWASVMDIVYSKYKDDENLKQFREYFGILSGMLAGIGAIDLAKLATWYFGQSHLEWMVNNAFGVDAIYVWMRWAFVLISVVFSGLTIERFAQIPDVKNVYSERRFYEIFLSFIVFALVYLLFQLANSTYMVDLIMLIVRIFAPLTVLGVTAYTVYLADTFLKLSASRLTE